MEINSGEIFTNLVTWSMKIFQIFQDFVEMKQTLPEHLWLVGQVEDRLGDGRDCLTSGVGREIDGQVRQAENAHQRHEAFLLNKFSAVIVGRVVGEDGVDELHDVVDVVDQRHGLFLSRSRWR